MSIVTADDGSGTWGTTADKVNTGGFTGEVGLLKNTETISV